MKFLLLDSPKYFSNEELKKIEDEYILVHLEQVLIVTIHKSKKSGSLELIDGTTFYLKQNECVELLQLIKDPQIIRPMSLDKVYKAIK